jgi:hypothetical protein
MRVCVAYLSTKLPRTGGSGVFVQAGGYLDLMRAKVTTGGLYTKFRVVAGEARERGFTVDQGGWTWPPIHAVCLK